MTGVVHGVFHPAISVTNMETALAFYRDTLGLVVTADVVHEPTTIRGLWGLSDARARSVLVQGLDGTDIELVEFERPRGRQTVDRQVVDAGIATLALRVSGIEDVAARINASGRVLGSSFVSVTQADGREITYALCRDPDGTPLVLVDLNEAGRGTRTDDALH